MGTLAVALWRLRRLKLGQLFNGTHTRFKRDRQSPFIVSATNTSRITETS